MTTTFSMTARDMVTTAMIELGVIASGAQPTADEQVDAIVRLNSMLKSWDAKGISMWRDTETTVPLLAGQGVIMLDLMPADVFQVRINTGSFDRPLARFEADEYSFIPNKATRGTPTSYTIFRTPSSMEMRLWPVPASATIVTYSAARIAEDVSDPTQIVDVPQMWQECVWMNLAARIANMYGKTRTDPQTVQMVMARAAELERDLMDRDRPASYQLGPDLSGYH